MGISFLRFSLANLVRGVVQRTSTDTASLSPTPAPSQKKNLARITESNSASDWAVGERWVSAF